MTFRNKWVCVIIWSYTMLWTSCWECNILPNKVICVLLWYPNNILNFDSVEIGLPSKTAESQWQRKHVIMSLDFQVKRVWPPQALAHQQMFMCIIELWVSSSTMKKFRGMIFYFLFFPKTQTESLQVTLKPHYCCKRVSMCLLQCGHADSSSLDNA